MQKSYSRRKLLTLAGACAPLAAVGNSISIASGARTTSHVSQSNVALQSPRPSTVSSPGARVNMNVNNIETIWLEVPFRPLPGRRMFAENYEWRYFQIQKVTLACGITGFGETMPYYTWGVPTEEKFAYARGRNPAELMWNDSLGAGLQMALFDAVGKAMDVPLYRLLGIRLRERAFVSWWDCALDPHARSS